MAKDSFDRRAFLKGAAATAAAVIGTQMAATNTPAEADESGSNGREAPSRDKVIARPGSDFHGGRHQSDGYRVYRVQSGIELSQPAGIDRQLWRQQKT